MSIPSFIISFDFAKICLAPKTFDPDNNKVSKKNVVTVIMITLNSIPAILPTMAIHILVRTIRLKF